MGPEELKKRTKQFALRVIKLCGSLPKSRIADVIGRQLLRAGTSVGANYRAACRAKSRADFAVKMAIVGEEADECCYWLELLTEGGLVKADRLSLLRAEAGELTAIATASRKTARSKKNKIP